MGALVDFGHGLTIGADLAVDTIIAGAIEENTNTDSNIQRASKAVRTCSGV